MTRKDFLYSFYFLIFSLGNGWAQTINLVKYWQNTDNATIDIIENQADTTLWLGGRFEKQLDFFPFTASSNGGDDIFLSNIDTDGNVLSFFSGGSSLEDKLAAIVVTSEQELFATGTFWIEATFGELTLRSNNSTQGVFLLLFNQTLQAQWGKVLSASISIAVEDVEMDRDQHLWLTGSFKGDLFFEDNFLFSSTKEVFMLLCFDTKGQLLRAFHGNPSVRNTGKALASMENGVLAFAGNFEGNLIWGNDTISTNTTDSDVFLATVSKDGTPFWLRKAGGVFRSELEAMEASGNNLFLAGNFIGVLGVSEQIQIQSLGFNDNIFLLAYQSDGIPLWAKSIGGAELEQVQALAIYQNHLLLGGYFLDQFKIDEIVLAGNPLSFNGFLLQTDKEGTVKWAKSLAADKTLLISDIAGASNVLYYASGYFQGVWRDFDYQNTAFNPFLIKIVPQVSSVVSDLDKAFDVFYHPLEKSLYITTLLRHYQVQIFDTQGKLWHVANDADAIHLHSLALGVYYVVIKYYDNSATFPIFITNTP
jgi:hypothetical protein